ncbi:FAD-dependent monooxygenase [Ureibacillus acetophenoni]
MTNTKVVDLLINDEKRIYGVQAMCEGKEITIESRLTVGADGRYSTVRQKAGIEVTKRKHGYDLLWTNSCSRWLGTFNKNGFN